MNGEVPGPVWRKSTRSGSQGGNCVEVAILPKATKLRDSKNPHGGTIDLTPQAWQVFLDSVKRDEFQRDTFTWDELKRDEFKRDEFARNQPD